ncbi:hypothetical protein C0992_013377, partial [Termitomyces sp. T32_za158]
WDMPMILLSSHSSQFLLLHTTITSSKETINTLIDSGANDNFIDKAWAALAPGSPGDFLSPFSFIINTMLGNSLEILSALINSRATKTFISDWLALLHQDIAKPLELQLYDGHPASSGPITKSYSSILTLDNGLWFPIDFLVTQLHESTLIVLGLPWLHDVNPH